MADETRPHVDFRGWRFFAPFICFGCGIEISQRQFAFSRSCGPCDLGRSSTRRLLVRRCFGGKRELIDANDRGFIQPESFVDPRDRLKYPILQATPRPKLPVHPRPGVGKPRRAP